jgi:hypothetical protein
MTALERDDVLANLSLLDFHEKQKDVFANHHRGTGQWLLNTYNFQKWFTDKETSVLWCPGIRTSTFHQLSELGVFAAFTNL